MSCVKGKATYPDLQTALVVRDQLIQRYGVPILAYQCQGGCLKWHLTTRPPTGRKIRRWNNIDTEKQMEAYNAKVSEAAARIQRAANQ